MVMPVSTGYVKYPIVAITIRGAQAVFLPLIPVSSDPNYSTALKLSFSSVENEWCLTIQSHIAEWYNNIWDRFVNWKTTIVIDEQHNALWWDDDCDQDETTSLGKLLIADSLLYLFF